VLCIEASAAPPVPPVIHAATIDRDPFGFRDADGNAQGISVDVYRLIATRLGRPLNVEFDAVDRITGGILAARIDIAVMFPHPELIDAAVAVGPVIDVQTGVLTRTRVARYEELSGMRVGYVDATPFDERFEADKTLKKVPFADAVAAFRAYEAGSIDAIAGPLQYLYYQAPQYAARKGELFQVFALRNREMWLYVRTAAFTDAERAAIAGAIDEMIEANMIEGFSEHYLGSRVGAP
jgi:ABC-type amino acid transport substrate-binding protein